MAYQIPNNLVEKVYSIIENAADFIYTWKNTYSYLQKLKKTDDLPKHSENSLDHYQKIIDDILEKNKIEFEVKKHDEKVGGNSSVKEEKSLVYYTKDTLEKILKMKKIEMDYEPYVDIEYFYP